MKKSYVVLILFSVLVLVSAGSLYDNPQASAQVESTEVPADYFLKLGDIEGEANHAQHKGEIVIDSFQWSEAVPLAAPGAGLRPGAGAGRVAMEDFFFAAPVSKASPRLMQAVAEGSRFDEAVFTVRVGMENVDPVLLKVTLQDVGVTSYHFAGMRNEPTENFSLNFGKITYAYNVLREDGTVAETIEGSWDLKTNTP